MTNINTLLIELGTEELPPKALKGLSDAFSANFEAELSKLGFSFSSIEAFAAPRRLVVSVNDCAWAQEDKKVEKKGPAVSAAFDDEGHPTRAAQGWAKSNGITVENAQRLKTDKGEWLLHIADVKGKALNEEIEGMLKATLKKLPIPKAMRWGTSSAEFIRPVHTVCALFGDTVVDCNILGIQSSNQVSGHRFHGAHRVNLDHAKNYKELMRQQFVLADYPSRMQKIKDGLLAKAEELGLVADFDQSLLEEISSLVEWPVVLTASFESSFLSVPKEALIYTMKDDQKYVPLLTKDGELSSQFLFVSNIESKDPSQVIKGNEKVIRPRLSDAQFFFETDKKTSLEDKANDLSKVLFQKELGTVADKSQRFEHVAMAIAPLLEQSADDAARAAKLCKADLMSNMVMEFPSVQGIMGKYYALHDGESQDIALAIEEHYLPRFSGDKLPSSKLGCVLAIAEKLDTLVGIFGIGKIPKGDKDPFALRRSAIGLLKILMKYELSISLSDLVSISITSYGDKLTNQQTHEQVVSFLSERYRPLFAESGFKADVIASVLATSIELPSDVKSRIEAVSIFKNEQSASSLVASNKRVSNILNKNIDALNPDHKIDQALFNSSEETTLNTAISELKDNVENYTQQSKYKDALVLLSQLKEPLEDFFENIMVMDDDLTIRQNRLALLNEAKQCLSGVADISKLAI